MSPSNIFPSVSPDAVASICFCLRSWSSLDNCRTAAATVSAPSAVNLIRTSGVSAMRYYLADFRPSRRRCNRRSRLSVLAALVARLLSFRIAFDNVRIEATTSSAPSALS